MIVKLIIHKEMNAISIWNKEGDRLYYSDKLEDIKVACDLLTVQKAKTDNEHAMEHMGIEYKPTFEQRMHGYFNACWHKKIVQLKKRASGYDW